VQNRAHLVADAGAARLARRDHVMPGGAQPLGQPRDLRRLPTAVRTLEGNK